MCSRSNSGTSTVAPAASMRAHTEASRSPAAPAVARSGSRRSMASASFPRFATTSRAICSAVVRSSCVATPVECSTVTSGSARAGSTLADASSGRAGLPASTTSATKAAAPAAAIVPRRARPPPRRSGTCVRTSTGRIAQTRKSAPSTATFVANSVVCGAISTTASRPIPIAYARRPGPVRGIVRGSLIMKKRKTRISGEKTRTRQNSQPVIGPRCQRAVISWPLAASTARPAAKASQKPTAISSSFSRRRIENSADGDDARARTPAPATSVPTRSRAGRRARARAAGSRGRGRSSTG